MIVVAIIGYEREEWIGVWIMVSSHDKKLIAKPCTSESQEYFSLNEAKKKLDFEYSNNRHELVKIAKRHSRKLEEMEPEELINETYKRFLTGERKWSKKKEFIQIFNETMRSIADINYKSEKLVKKIFVSENIIKNDKEYSLYEKTSDQSENQEEEIIHKQEEQQLKKEIKKLLKGDSIAQAFLDLFFEGYTRKEIIEKLQINEKKYSSIYKKVHRRLVR